MNAKEAEALLADIKLIRDSQCNCVGYSATAVNCHVQNFYNRIELMMKNRYIK
jgi:hypothetical protein